MIGKTYLERGRSVVVLVRWGKGGGPGNVLIQREDGTKVVRPFGGLRNARKLEASVAPRKHCRSWNAIDHDASVEYKLTRTNPPATGRSG
jgi:hypothetical protein